MEYLEYIMPFWESYDIFFYAGLLSSFALMVTKFANKENKWTSQFMTSFFVALLVGILVRNVTPFNKELIFVVAAAAGYYARDILEELRDIISNISVYANKLILKYTGLKEDKIKACKDDRYEEVLIETNIEKLTEDKQDTN